MPISTGQRPPEPSPAAIEANRRGVWLRSQGRLAEAAQAFREGLCVEPNLALLHSNLATTLAEAGDIEGARQAFERALAHDPDLSAALCGLGSLHVRTGDFPHARACYERVLARDPDDVIAHQAMYELEQIDGNLPKALEHQRRILERKTLFSAYAPQEQRRLLALLVPGDWQANVPLEFLIDARTTTLHKWYLLSRDQAMNSVIPRADAVMTAIGESEEAAQALELAAELLPRIGLPSINDPRRIRAANREQISRVLSQIAHVHAPRVTRVERSALGRCDTDTPLPLVIRPVGSQAGRGLARIADRNELDAYVSGASHDAFYVMPFVDFRSADGHYRKYRIIVVDGVPYPYHLAISPNWMIHYYNAPMRETAWMREEEAFFLAHFEEVFRDPLQRALRESADALGLEYFGLDCSIDPQGRLLVFEADPAMVVHAGDDPQVFGYKIPYAQRIFDAFQRLIDRVGSR